MRRHSLTRTHRSSRGLLVAVSVVLLLGPVALGGGATPAQAAGVGPDAAGILAETAPACSARFSTTEEMDAPFEQLTEAADFWVEVTFDRPALVDWVTALTSTGEDGPLVSLWGIDPSTNLRNAQTALSVRAVDATTSAGGLGTGSAVSPTVAIGTTDIESLSRSLFGPDAGNFGVDAYRIGVAQYSAGTSSLVDYPTRFNIGTGTEFNTGFATSPLLEDVTELDLTAAVGAWGLAAIGEDTPFRPEVVLWLRLSTPGSPSLPTHGVVVLPCGGPATLPVVDPPAPVASGPSVSCAPDALTVGTEVTCTVTGGDPGIDILWRAAVNPVIASEGVTLDADGRGTFDFTVPASAAGSVVTVELVEWTTPVAIGGGAVVGGVGGPVPTSVPAGEGGGGPVGLLALIALLGAVGAAGAAGAAGASRGRRPGFCPVEKSSQNL